MLHLDFYRQKNEGLICFLIAPFFAFPFAIENTIHGFQSQMYFLEIFALITIVGMGFGSPGTTRWFVGLCAAIMSLFTMGSGLLASLAVIGLMTLRTLKQKKLDRNNFIVAGCGFIIFIIGLLLNVTVKADLPYQAKSFLEFLAALTGDLAWPFEDHSLLLIFVCLPLLVLGVEYFRPDFKNPRASEFILAFGFWGFLQSAALAYGRVNMGNSSRYMDTLSVIPIASAASLLVIWQTVEFRKLSKPLLIFFAMIWMGFLLGKTGKISFLPIASRDSVKNCLPGSRPAELMQEENVRAFVATGDPKFLQRKPASYVPYWSSDLLVEFLRDPKLSGIMPPSCRPALKVEKDPASGASFVLDGCPPQIPKQEFTRVWGDYSTNGTPMSGHFASKPLFATLPKLMVQLCCGQIATGAKFQFVELATGRTHTIILPSPNRWQTIIVDAPKNPFRLEMTDGNSSSWIAAGQIEELGRLSFYALFLLNHAVEILLAGLFLFALLAGFGVISGRNGFWWHGFTELFILLISFFALGQVWSARNFDATGYTRQLHKNWAAYFTSIGDPTSAELHLHEALWLQPDDPETFVTLANIILHDPNLGKNDAREQAVSALEAALQWEPDSLAIKNQLHDIAQPR